MPDECDVAKIELFDNSGKICGQSVIVVTASRIFRTAVPAPVVGDAAETLFAQLGELIFPYIGVECPWMTKDDRRPVTPVADEQLCAVAGFNKRSEMSLLWTGVRLRRGRSTHGGDHHSAHRNRFHNRSSLHRSSSALNFGAAICE